MGNGQYRNQNGEDIDLTVLVFTRPNLRSDELEMEAYLGRGILESLFDTFEQRPDVETAVFSFPERMLNMLEQRALLQRLVGYCPNLSRVFIKTHSAFIIQTAHHKHVRIVTPHKIIEEGGKLSDRLYCGPEAGGIFPNNGVTVL